MREWTLTPYTDLDAILPFDLGQIGLRVGEVVWIKSKRTPEQSVISDEVFYVCV